MIIASERGSAHADTPTGLTPTQAEAIVRVVEAAPHLRRRHQFFVWAQSVLQVLLPHDVLSCGAYQRERRDLVFEVFQSIVLPPSVLTALRDVDGPLMPTLLEAWVDGGARPLHMSRERLAQAGAQEVGGLLGAHGIHDLTMHGVARPRRPAEVESFFVFARTAGRAPFPLEHLELLLPHLHAGWLRVMADDDAPAGDASPAPHTGPQRRALTDRERQILGWVRDGKSNQQIADVLGLSPLTVKNHVQKILRKLDASNRAQAVAKAMALGLLNGERAR